MNITSAHGGGGRLMNELIRDIFGKYFSNPTLDCMEDAALLPQTNGKIAFTTDSFVVSPLFFPGGDIGRLSVCGTVNDLLMRGAVPKYLSAGFILEEGLDFTTLERAVASMKRTADEAGVEIVTGDTKVIEGKGGMYINTAGIGILESPVDISVQNAKAGDAVVVSGLLGDHHACILSSRMGIENDIRSDCAPPCGNGKYARKKRRRDSYHARHNARRASICTARNSDRLPRTNRGIRQYRASQQSGTGLLRYIGS